MGRWSGAAVTMPVGCNWTYKLQLQEQTASGTQAHLVLGRGAFPTEAEAQAAGEAHLKTELTKRSA